MAPKRALSKSSTATSQPKRKRTKEMIEDEQYFVEEILDERTNADGEHEYLVHWEGYPRNQATWEPSDNINEDDLADFIAQRDEDISSQEGDDDEEEEEVEEEEEETIDRPAVVEDTDVVESGASYESDDEAVVAEEEDGISVSSPSQRASGQSVIGESTNNSRINDGHAISSVSAETHDNESSVIADTDSRIVDESDRLASVSRSDRATQAQRDESVIITAEEVEAVLGVDLGLGRFWAAQ